MTGPAIGTTDPDEGPRPFIFVTVGTAPFPWPRLMEWLDEWLEGRDHIVHCFVQTGPTPPPKRAPWAAFLPYPEMESNVEQATAVVTHAAPASVLLCRGLGRKAIVVPRERRYGEHVDDHQIMSGRRMAAQGWIELAETKDRLHELLARSLADPQSFRLERTGDDLSRTVQRIGELLENLLARG